jgi:hypothetical protein
VDEKLQALERRLGHLDGVIGGLIKVAEHTSLGQRLDRFDQQLNRLTELLTSMAGQVSMQHDNVVEGPQPQAATPQDRYPPQPYDHAPIMSDVRPPTSIAKRLVGAVELAPTAEFVVDASEITIARSESAPSFGIDSGDLLLDDAPQSEGAFVNADAFSVDGEGEAASVQDEEDGQETSALEDVRPSIVAADSSPAAGQLLHTPKAATASDDQIVPPGPQLTLIPPTPETSQEQVMPIEGRTDPSSGSPIGHDPPLDLNPAAGSSPPLDEVPPSVTPRLAPPDQLRPRTPTPQLEVPDVVGARTRSASRSPAATPQKRRTESGDERGGKKRRVGRGL